MLEVYTEYMHNYPDTWEAAKQSAVEHGLEVVEHGWEQHVIVDEPNGLVFRYPRHQAAADKLVDEVALLGALNQSKWPVRIPYLRHHTSEYTVYDYIPGDVIDAKVASQLNDTEATQLGYDLGVFLSELHQADPKVVEQKITKQTMSLLDYYKDRIEQGESSEFYNMACQDLAVITNHPVTDHVVVHGDLHGLNIVIDPADKKLVGIIDFSELEIGDPHQDFRKLFMTDERLLEPSIRAYKQCTGKELSEAAAKAWAYVNEWANVCYFSEEPANPTYKRARNHLKKWGRL